MDNQHDQSKVAYESAPKEINRKRGMPSGKDQFGKGNKMPQENKGHVPTDYPANPSLNRFGESR